MMCINRRVLRPSLALCVVFACVFCRADEQRCVVATVQPLATDAGVAAFEKGGNAVDAAVAGGPHARGGRHPPTPAWAAAASC